MSDDLTGKVFVNWTVLGPASKTGYWECVCNCEAKVRRFVIERNLLSGRSKSCGCYRTWMISRLMLTHGMSSTPLFRVWGTMLDRCGNPNTEQFRDYGGRGISVSDEWRASFESFYADMGAGYQKGLTLERRDNDGNYCKENCYWATRMVQGSNKRNNVWIDTPQGRMTVAQAARVAGCNAASMAERVASGWSSDQILQAPRKLTARLATDEVPWLKAQSAHYGLDWKTVRSRIYQGWPRDRWFEPLDKRAQRRRLREAA